MGLIRVGNEQQGGGVDPGVGAKPQFTLGYDRSWRQGAGDESISNLTGAPTGGFRGTMRCVMVGF